MTVFFRLLNIDDKEKSLKEAIENIGNSEVNKETYFVNPSEFQDISGAPFAYWVSTNLRKSFISCEKVENDNCTARQGLATSDDFRFIRTTWESQNRNWPFFAKGGDYSLYFYDLHLRLNWQDNGKELKSLICQKYPYLKDNWEFVIKNTSYYKRPGITWPRRTQKGLGMRLLPEGCIIADKGPAIYVKENNKNYLLALQGVVASIAFKNLVELQMCFGSYEVGVISRTPIPLLSEKDVSYIAEKVINIWQLKMSLSKSDETSNYFILPEVLLTDYSDKTKIQNISLRIQELHDEINSYCFKLYKYSKEDMEIAKEQFQPEELINMNESTKSSRELELISWAVGVAFSRFNRDVSVNDMNNKMDYKPFSSLLELDATASMNDSKYTKDFIFTNVRGQPHDLAYVIRKVLSEIGKDNLITIDLDSWVNSEFFKYHIKRHSKSRRQAPIYWPLQTASGSYTLWVYYHRLNSQTLYSCVNDFVEPKLALVTEDLNALSNRSNRSSTDEKELTKLTDLQNELKDFRDELLRLAKIWKPNLNDGVQITAAPLWKLFQHTAWQKKLKETWENLEEGEYDWAHLAASIWPDRVLRKCHQDRSLAIAHDVEDLFWQEVEVPIMRGKKPTGQTKLEWQPIPASETTLNEMVNEAKARLQ